MNEIGGIRDDLMVANLDNHLLLVVNASRKRDDEDYLIERLARVCMVECLSDLALIALQGRLRKGFCLLSYQISNRCGSWMSINVLADDNLRRVAVRIYEGRSI
jgi:glycine cleavage system aminomethyltransferase T